MQPSMEDPLKQKQTLSFKFKQQILKAWQPIPTLTKSIVLFAILSAVFLSLAVVLQVFSGRIKDYKIQYDVTCGSNTICTIPITLTEDISGPVYVYYELHHFYQNHRIYVRSIDESQLRGNYRTASQISLCDPIIYNKDLYVTTSITGAALNPDEPANPCGLIAYTYFNDTFTLSNGSSIAITDNGIDWPNDNKYFNPKLQSQMWLNTSLPRVRVWMRVAALPDFRKIWGKIDGNLAAGTYTLTINNIYNVSSIKGSKYFVLSQTNDLGGKNYFLAIMYFIVGGICLAFMLLFLVLKLIKRRNTIALDPF